MVRPRGFDEEQALQKAMEVFWVKGYEATSISDLEQELALGRQSIYNVLGDKRQLFLKALESYARRNRDVIDRTLIRSKEGLEAVRGYFLEAIRAVTECKPRRACLIVNTVMENATSDPEIAAACRASHQYLARGFRAAVERAIANGELAKKTDVGTMVTMLLAQAFGLSVLAKSGVSTEELRRGVAVLIEKLS